MSTKAVQPYCKALDTGACRLAKTGLIIDGKIEWDAWVDLGSHFRHAAGSVQWWIGDWLNHGEKKFKGKCAEIMTQSDYDYQTLADAKWVSGEIEFSRRREKLSWSHHREVASLNNKAEQDAWLAKAEAEGWSMRELRSAIRAMRNEASPKEEPGLLDKAKKAVQKLGKEDKVLFLKWVQDEYADEE